MKKFTENQPTVQRKQGQVGIGKWGAKSGRKPKEDAPKAMKKAVEAVPKVMKKAVKMKMKKKN